MFDHYGGMGTAIAALLYGSLGQSRSSLPKDFTGSDYNDAGWITKDLEPSEKSGQFHAPYQPSALSGQFRAASAHIHSQASEIKEEKKKHYWESNFEHEMEQQLSVTFAEGASALLGFYRMMTMTTGSGIKRDELNFEEIKNGLFASAEKYLEEVHLRGNLPNMRRTSLGMRAVRPEDDGSHSAQLHDDGFEFAEDNYNQDVAPGESEMENMKTDNSSSAQDARAEQQNNNSARRKREQNEEGVIPDQNTATQELGNDHSGGANSMAKGEEKEQQERDGAEEHWTRTRCLARRRTGTTKQKASQSAGDEQESMAEEESTTTKGEHRSLSGGGPESLGKNKYANDSLVVYWFITTKPLRVA